MLTANILQSLVGQAEDKILSYDDTRDPVKVGADGKKSFVIYKRINGVESPYTLKLYWGSRNETENQQHVARSYLFAGKGEKTQKKPADAVIPKLCEFVRENGLDSVVEIDPECLLNSTEAKRLAAEDLVMVIIGWSAADITCDRVLGQRGAGTTPLPELHSRATSVDTTREAYFKLVQQRITVGVAMDYWLSTDLAGAWKALAQAPGAIGGCRDMNPFELMDDPKEGSLVAARALIFLGLGGTAAEVSALLEPMKQRLNRWGAPLMSRNFFNIVCWHKHHGYRLIDETARSGEITFEVFLKEHASEILEEMRVMDQKVPSAGGGKGGMTLGLGLGLGGGVAQARGGWRQEDKSPSAQEPRRGPSGQVDLQKGTAFEIDQVHFRRLDKRVHCIVSNTDGIQMRHLLTPQGGQVETPVFKNLEGPKFGAPDGCCFFFHNKQRGCNMGSTCNRIHQIDPNKPPPHMTIARMNWGEVIEQQKVASELVKARGGGGKQKNGRSNKNGGGGGGKGGGGPQPPANPWKEDSPERATKRQDWAKR